jgi:outer membrane receptor protein involved in Fe transport
MSRLPYLVTLLASLSALGAVEVAAPLDDVALIDEAGWVEAVSRRRQRVETAPQPVTVLSAADLVNTPAFTIPDRLRYEAGIDVYQSRHGQYDVGLNGWNGLNNNRIQVLVDGDELRQEEFGAITWIGTVHQTAVRRIEIIKGPASVAYGANAFGGVIAIQERQADDRHRLWTSGAVGDHGRYEADATGMGPLGGRFFYRLSAGGTRLDALPTTTGSLPVIPSERTGDLGNRDLETGHWTATGGAILAKDHRLEATWRGQRQPTWALIDDYDLGVNDTRTDWDDAVLRLRGPVVDAKWRRRWSDRTYQGTKAQYDPAQEYEYIQAGFASVEDVVRVQANLTGAGNTVSFGGEYTDWRSSSNLWGSGDFSDDSTWTDIRIRNRAVFLEDQWAPATWLTLTAGLRYDDQDVVGGNASPRVAVNLIPDQSQYVLLSYSSGYRLPAPLESQIQELYFTADPDLGAERVGTLELAWRKRWADLDAATGLGGFFSRGQDLILPMPLDAQVMAANWLGWLGSGPDLSRQPGPFLAYTNLDNPAYLGGLEFDGRIRLFDSPAVLWANATWQEFGYSEAIDYSSAGFTDPLSGATLFSFTEQLPTDVNGPPRFKGNLGLNTDRGPLIAGVAGRYVGSRTALSIGNSELATAQYVAVERIAAYAALDLTLGWRFAVVDGFLRAAVLDVLDAGGAQVIGTSSESLDRNLEHAGPSEIGRTWALQGAVGF